MFYSFAVAFVFLVGVLFSQRNYLRQPHQINVSEVGDIQLTIKRHVADIQDAQGRSIATSAIRAYDYNGTTRFIGPTIRATRNMLVNVTLVNNLRGVGRLTEILNETASGGLYHDPDVVNLHSHGLHVSPAVDDILLWANPLCPELEELESLLNYSRNFTDIEYYDIIDEWDCWFDGKGINNSQGTHFYQNYPYQIPENHYPGTHWYHSHWHGSTTFHVIQGLYGLFIVEDLDEYSPEVKFGWEEIQLLFGFSWLHTSDVCFNLTGNLYYAPVPGMNTTTPGYNGKVGPLPINGTLRYTRPSVTSTAYPFQFPVQSLCMVYAKMWNEYEAKSGVYPISFEGNLYSQSAFSDVKYGVEVNDSIITETEIETINSINGTRLFLVNGQIQPFVKMVISKWYHFRMVNTVMNYLFFWIRNDGISNSTYDMCDFYVMGQDGIYFENGPRNLYDSPYKYNQVVVQPGARADLAVRCDCNASVNESCLYDIWAYGDIDDFEYGFAPFPLSSIPIMILEVTNDGLGLANWSDFSDWMPEPYDMTDYLKDTQNNENVSAFCAEADFSGEDMSQCNIVHGRTNYPSGTARSGQTRPAAGGSHFGQVSMNQVQFAHSSVLAKVCTDNYTHEWMVTSNFHPFHHHTWPFQVQENITFGWFAMAGDWRDVMGAAGTFRQRSNYYIPDNSWNDGKLIMHCHYVPHEDHGMMVQVGLMNYSECSAYANKYISTVEYASGAMVGDYISVYDEEINSSMVCASALAQALIIATDVNMGANVTLAISTDCTLTFNITIHPRSIDIGNMWFALGFGGTYQFSDITEDSFFVNSANKKISMTGTAVIFSFQSDGNTSFTELYTSEAVLSNLYRTTTNVNTFENETYFNCDEYMVDDSSVSFSCSRSMYFGSSVDVYSSLDANQNFIWAYGEGRFESSKSYHSSRAGCKFSFGHLFTICLHSQNEVAYNTTDIPWAYTTAAITETTALDSAIQYIHISKVLLAILIMACFYSIY